ncbi:hypothetical protein APASM_6157 [Actinosynnema pretiosum subsp. pretiosum]|nr:hypothetical protein APASM_6157 [Actinosynnema pretiosum subsp. pretiosum]
MEGIGGAGVGHGAPFRGWTPGRSGCGPYRAPGVSAPPRPALMGLTSSDRSAASVPPRPDGGGGSPRSAAVLGRSPRPRS